MKLIINSDDFGYSKGHNYGILRAHTHGLLSSTTLMANGSEVLHAIDLALQHPTLDVGIHVVLDFKKPLSDPSMIPSCVDALGNFRKLSLEEVYSLELEEVKQEIEAQISFLTNQGLKLTHMDSHHHVHMHPHLFPVFVQLAKHHDLVLRCVIGKHDKHVELLKEANVKYVMCNATFYKETVSLDFFKPYPKVYEVEELMTHPAYCDEIILQESSYAYERVVELSVLTSPQLTDILNSQSIEVINYHHIKENL
ncbi:MAG: ChbG/HpnK family deacetylase [Erysipelothrix sp.]|nr:ChbG/HpnK family deacetylase [Erysipelothrix sp.]